MVLGVSSKTSNSFHVVLLKTNDHQTITDNLNKQSDRYVEFLKCQNLEKISKIDKINLLCFESINRQILIDKILNLYTDYSSLILTSRQTVEAIEASLEAISKSKELMGSINEISAQNKISVYCVGEATATRFRSLLAKIDNSLIGNRFFNADRFVIKQPDFNKNTMGESDDHKQNGREMAKLLVEDFKSSNKQNQAKTFAFYPCSSIRKDDLSNALTREHVTFDELHVYQTTHSETGLVNLGNLLKNALEADESICLVVFSPSCANAIFSNSELASLISSSFARFKFVSVGPSTSSELRKHVRDIFELREPSPEALKEVFD